MTVVRRQLKFDSFDDVVAEVERLRAGAYEKAGTWDLAQVCDHLAAWATYPVEGFPKAPLPIAVILRLVRATLGRGMYQKYMREGMPAGKPTMPQSVVAAGGDPAAAIERLKSAYTRFKAHAGEYLPSPLFGQLTREEAMAIQLRHAEHHLSFLVPK
jgi:hypothetical protein